MRPGRLALAFASVCLLLPSTASAGPPYLTDDPEPVKYQHWEFYLASQDTITRDLATGTAPHVEVNYGVVPNLQLHLLAPLAYAKPDKQPLVYGPGDVEVGAKFRFIQEAGWVPMVGTFPLVELPAGSERRDLGTGRLHGFVPLWLQKSSGDWTTYGGGGYWLNPGTGNKDYWYAGWLVQRRLVKGGAFGGEVFYETPDHVGGNPDLRFNLGGVIDFTDHHHLLLSAGRSIDGDTLFQSYLAYQLTL